MHADFGSGLYQGSIIGIPYSVVGGTQAPVNINFTAYGDESDPGPMPVPANAQIEGGPNPTGGDRHVLVLDNDNCFLYELFSAVPNGNGSWNADSAAVWDLLSDATTRSVRGRGHPPMPRACRFSRPGRVTTKSPPDRFSTRFALRFRKAGPRCAAATHWASNSTNTNAPPMGMRLRLKAGYNISAFSTNMQVILTAMKKYGMIMADNGSVDVHQRRARQPLGQQRPAQPGQVPASAFEVVQMNPVYTASNVPQGAAPAISSFTASPTT